MNTLLKPIYDKFTFNNINDLENCLDILFKAYHWHNHLQPSLDNLYLVYLYPTNPSTKEFSIGLALVVDREKWLQAPEWAKQNIRELDKRWQQRFVEKWKLSLDETGET